MNEGVNEDVDEGVDEDERDRKRTSEKKVEGARREKEQGDRKGFDGKNIIDLGLTLPSIIIIYNGDAERWCHRMQFMTWKDN